MTGYGPQENWSEEEKMPFFIALEEEISKAQMANKSIILELDANSKLGSKYVKHQREVGASYFDQVGQVCTGSSNLSSIEGSTEKEQF